MKKTIEDLAREVAQAYRDSDRIASDDPRWRKASDRLWKAMDALADRLGIK